MRKYHTIFLIGIKEIKYLFKRPLFYVIMIGIIIITLSSVRQLFNTPYDSEEKYNQRLGYIPYEQFQKMSFEDFYIFFAQGGKAGKKIQKIDQDYQFHVYEDKMTLEERLELEELKENDIEKYSVLFEKLVSEGKILDYGLLNYQQIKDLSKEDYNKICHSLYVPWFSSGLLYFANAKSDKMITYPTYSEAKELSKLENMSNLIAREYFYRITSLLCLFSGIIVVISLMKDYTSKATNNIYSSKISSTQYILGKYISINLLVNILCFIITILPAAIFILSMGQTEWVYKLTDFVKYFFGIFTVSAIFVNSLSFLIVICSRNLIFSLATIFYYIFLFSYKTKISNGIVLNEISIWHLIPRVQFRLGIMQSQHTNFIYHQLYYIIFSIVLIVVSVFTWNQIRIKGGLINAK